MSRSSPTSCSLGRSSMWLGLPWAATLCGVASTTYRTDQRICVTSSDRLRNGTAKSVHLFFSVTDGSLDGCRLAGTALVMPGVNYYWPMPANVWERVYSKLDVGDQRTFWIAHHMPWLFYAWFNQKWFRISQLVDGKREAFTEKDWEILTQMPADQVDRGKAAGGLPLVVLRRDDLVWHVGI